MKNIGLIVLALVLGAGVVSGCAEKKQPKEEAGEAAVQEQKAEAQKPADAHEEPPAAPAPGQEKVVEKALEVKAEAAAAVEKVAGKAEEKVAAVEKAAVQDVEAGAAIFKSKCAPCHGLLGKGTPMAPAFAGNEWIKSAADADIAGVIKNGRDGAAKRYPKFPIGMPSNKGMADGDISALVGYLRSIN